MFLPEFCSESRIPGISFPKKYSVIIESEGLCKIH